MEVSLEMKMKALEIAERTLSNYRQQSNGLSSGGYIDKDMREIILRADRFLAWATGTEESDKATLISKLKAALCETP